MHIAIEDFKSIFGHDYSISVGGDKPGDYSRLERNAGTCRVSSFSKSF
jgi:hypothetical protein